MPAGRPRSLYCGEHGFFSCVFVRVLCLPCDLRTAPPNVSCVSVEMDWKRSLFGEPPLMLLSPFQLANCHPRFQRYGFGAIACLSHFFFPAVSRGIAANNEDSGTEQMQLVVVRFLFRCCCLRDNQQLTCPRLHKHRHTACGL